MQAPTACLIIIGNEILSGRTQDKNVNWLALRLGELGVKLMETRIIPDIPEMIITTVNACRMQFTYVFTTGGIGPTHDDITSECIAKAFGVALHRSPEARAILERHYGADNLNEARLKMADIPLGASLIANPVSAAPGFMIENVYVMAGVPRIMNAMFDGIKHQLQRGIPILSRTISAYTTEGIIAEALTAIQNAHPEVEIGSYPFMREGKLGTSLVARGTDEAKLAATYQAIRAMLFGYTTEVVESDLAS